MIHLALFLPHSAFHADKGGKRPTRGINIVVRLSNLPLPPYQFLSISHTSITIQTMSRSKASCSSNASDHSRSSISPSTTGQKRSFASSACSDSSPSTTARKRLMSSKNYSSMVKGTPTTAASSATTVPGNSLPSSSLFLGSEDVPMRTGQMCRICTLNAKTA